MPISVPVAAREIRKEEATRTRLYQRISPLVGAFDHAEMSAEEMATYGLKKLGLKPGQDPVTAIGCYLDGRDQAAASRSGAMDGDYPKGGLIDRYLKSKA